MAIDMEAIRAKLNKPTRSRFFNEVGSQEDGGVIEYTGRFQNVEFVETRSGAAALSISFIVETSTDDSVREGMVLKEMYQIEGAFDKTPHMKRFLIGMTGGDPATDDIDGECPQVSKKLLAEICDSKAKVVQTSYASKRNPGKIYSSTTWYKTEDEG